MIKHLPFAAMAAAMLLSAGTCSEKTDTNAAAGTIGQGKWVLEKLHGQPIGVPSPDRTPYLMVDSAGHVNGFAGCNRIFGPLAVHGDSISFSGLAATRMYCEESQKLEDDFLAALNASKTFKMQNGQLILLGGKELAVFRRSGK